MNQLVLLSPSHIITVCLSLAAIIYIPRLFRDSSDNVKKSLEYLIIFLLLINQAMDFYREGIMSERWQEGLPLHLCDFSTMAIILYFITRHRDFFVFAFFFGNSSTLPRRTSTLVSPRRSTISPTTMVFLAIESEP